MWHEVSAQDWLAREAAWHTRVETLGVERAVYHKKHKTPDAFAAVTKLQEDTIWPILIRERGPTDHLVLDFGCGHGRWTAKLAATFGSAIGVDPTPVLLEHARQTQTGPLVEFRPYRYGHIPVQTESIDVLWSCMVLSTILDPVMLQVTLAELRRVVHLDALIVLIDNTSMSDGRPVRSTYSISRTIGEYQAAFAPWVKLTTMGAYTDFEEINTVFTGRVHA